MPALSFRFEKLNIAITHDGVTLYPKFNKLKENNLSFHINPTSHQLVFDFLSPEGAHLSAALSTIKKLSPLHFLREVSFAADDHNLYHQDNLSPENKNECEIPHQHLKFSVFLDNKNIGLILEVLTQHELISREEAFTISKTCAQRDEETTQQVSEIIKTSSTVLQDLMNYVIHCDQIAVLIAAYSFIVNSKHNFKENIIKSCIALQALYILTQHSKKFTKEYAREEFEKIIQLFPFITDDQEHCALFLNAQKEALNLFYKNFCDRFNLQMPAEKKLASSPGSIKATDASPEKKPDLTPAVCFFQPKLDSSPAIKVEEDTYEEPINDDFWARFNATFFSQTSTPLTLEEDETSSPKAKRLKILPGFQ